MSTEFSTLMGWDHGRLPEKQWINVEDTLKLTGDFMLMHLLEIYLKKGYGAIVISTGNTLFHYQSILRKLGLNSTALINQGKFHFISCLVPVEYLDSSSSSSSSSSSNAEPRTCEQLYQKIRGIFTQVCVQSKIPCLILIDNIQELGWTWAPDAYLTSSSLLQDIDKSQVLFLLNYCQVLLQSGISPASVLITLQHGDVDDDRSFVKFVNDSADLNIFVDPIPSGRSETIDGQLQFHLRSQFANPNHPLPALLQFKVFDNCLKVYRPGQAPIGR